MTDKVVEFKSGLILDHHRQPLVRLFLFGGAPDFQVIECGLNLKNVEDIQFHCGAIFFAVPELIEEMKKDNLTENFLSCVISTVASRDKGSVHLKSLHPNDQVELKINFLEYDEDLNSMFEGFTEENLKFVMCRITKAKQCKCFSMAAITTINGYRPETAGLGRIGP